MEAEWSIEDKEYIRGKIRSIMDFPKPGIEFRDITTLLKDGKAFAFLINKLASRYKHYGIDYIAAIESRGFILGAPLARELGVGFVPVRKKGKLPATTINEKYALEYGFDEMEIHLDAFADKKNAQVLLIDDLVATGGTAEAAFRLITSAKAQCVEACFLLNLVALEGKARMQKFVPVFSVLDV